MKKMTTMINILRCPTFLMKILEWALEKQVTILKIVTSRTTAREEDKWSAVEPYERSHPQTR